MRNSNRFYLPGRWSCLWAAVAVLLVARTASPQQLPPAPLRPAMSASGPASSNATVLQPAGLGAGTQIRNAHVPPASFASPPLAVSSGQDIDASTATTLGIKMLAREYGPALRLLSVIPLVDIHDAVIAYDIDVAFPGSSHATYGGIAGYWQDYCAKVRGTHNAQFKKGVAALPDTASTDRPQAQPEIASITVSASYDYPPVRSYSRTPSNFYAGGWIASEIATRALAAYGPVQLEKIYLTGPGARSYVFSAGTRRIVVEGQEPYAWCDYDPFLAAAVKNEASRIADIAGQLQQKGLGMQSVIDSARSAYGAATRALLTSAALSPVANHYVPGGYPGGFFEPAEWHYGCSPTAASAVYNYWENRSFYGLLNERYFSEWSTPEGDFDCHVSTAQRELAALMGTDPAGFTASDQIYPAMQNHANAHGYCFSGGPNWAGQIMWIPFVGLMNLHWGDIRSEIDAGYPFVWSLEWFPNATAPHSVFAGGYTDDGFVICYSGWSNNGNQLMNVNSVGGLLDWNEGAAPHPGCNSGFDIKIVSPDGSQAFGQCGHAGLYLGGGTMNTLWTNRGRPADAVDILLSTDGGGQFRTIAVTADDGSFTWPVPCGIISTNCRIALRQWSGGTLVSEDGSYGNFEIAEVAPANITGLPVTMCGGQTCDLRVSVYGTQSSLSWSSSCGGSFSQPSSVATAWTAPLGFAGSCQIRVRVNYDCASTEGTATTTLLGPGAPSIAGLPRAVCAGQTYTLSASASGNVTGWNWNSSCGGSFRSPGSSSTTWTAPSGYTGNCQITVTASNFCGSISRSASTTVGSGPVGAPAIQGLPEAVCADQTYDLSVSASGNPADWSWSSSCGGKFNAPTSSSPSWRAPREDTGFCQITVMATNGCDTAYGIVSTKIDKDLGRPTITGLPASVCGGHTYSLVAFASGYPTSWSWESNCGGDFGSPGSDSTSWTAPLGYTGPCRITVTAANSCGSEDNNVTTTVVPGPSAPVITGLPGNVCGGQKYNLNANASGNPTGWRWSSECGGSFRSPSNRSTEWIAPTEYTGACEITVTAMNDCDSAEGSATITVDQDLGLPVITGLPGAVCVGQTYNLAASASGTPRSWSWTANCGGSFGSPGSDSTTWTAPLRATSCEIRVVAANSCGSTSGSATTTVGEGTVGTPEVRNLSATSCGGKTYNLDARATGKVIPTGWSWSSSCGGSFESPGSQSTLWTAPAGYTGTCQISVAATNGCDTASGTDSTTLTCACHADPQCDGVRSTVHDVVRTADVAFRNVPPVLDPQCSREQTDVDCDGVTTVHDVVRVVNVAFRSGSPAAEYCDPCPP